MVSLKKPLKKSEISSHASQLKGREVIDQSISSHDYPHLGLGDNEYVIVDVERSKIGLVLIWSAVAFVSLLMIVFCQIMVWTLNNFETTFLMVLLGYITIIVAMILGVIESRIYNKNYMVVSNQRVFNQIQNGPFATRTKVIEIENIEDVAVRRSGLLSTLLNYGEIRLSTERDDLTYRLSFVKSPDTQIEEIKKAVNTAME